MVCGLWFIETPSFKYGERLFLCTQESESVYCSCSPSSVADFEALHVNSLFIFLLL